MRWAVLVGGTGSNLRALLSEDVPVALVVSHRSGVGAIAIAEEFGVPVEVLTKREYPDRHDFDRELRQTLNRYDIDAIAMAGFLRWLTKETVDAFRGRIINIHPSLLPAFPGLHAIEQAYRYGVRWTGVTVHFVDEGQDTGPIIAQVPVRVDPGTSLGELETAIHKVEHDLYPKVVAALEQHWVWLAEDGTIKWQVPPEEVRSWIDGLYLV
ncbi:MAG: phosphoribosylglycinamide formyltransferase [Sulfobacillus benefaciens]|uniref:Phosphoribosylglycinamide formyltransferase n=1 Tax=Sulfobacillus benefaciens TaxID=453960 RepID=A0A2T2XFD6_9FIRM|nr:MAG: phosphoribosylglycinamide formyltransferase [Sulfobacillus benefaciens]